MKIGWIRYPLAVALLLSRVPPAGCGQVDECGFLSNFSGCWTFEPIGGGEWIPTYVLETTGSFEDGDLVRVTGASEYCDVQCGSFRFRDRIPEPTITPCEPESLGCGFLFGPTSLECSNWIWISPRWGELLLPPVAEYAAGESVLVIGNMCHCGNTCNLPFPTVLQLSLYPCGSPTASQAASWGSLKCRYR